MHLSSGGGVIDRYLSLHYHKLMLKLYEFLNGSQEFFIDRDSIVLGRCHLLKSLLRNQLDEFS